MMMIQYDADGKYKTELCKNWIETAKCRYESKCRFAHGQEELTQAARRVYNDKFKSKNCRTFYHTKQCMYGTRCMFRHEHRNIKQLHRHYYTPQIYVFETLFRSASSKAAFVCKYEPVTTTLSVFSKIHDEYDEQVAAEAQAQQETSDSEISDIEMSPEMIKAASYGSLIMEKVQAEGDSISRSFLNTTQDSTNEDSPQKFPLSLLGGAARFSVEQTDSQECSDEGEDDLESEDLDVSPRSLGLDFV
jgi:hypothetical protein